MLRVGVCSIGAGIAAVALVLAVKSVATHTPGQARDGSSAERIQVSVPQTWHHNSPAYRTLVFSPNADDARVRLARLEGESAAAADTPSDESTSFDERYSLRDRFASFDERFVGVARLIRRVAAGTVTTERILPRYASASAELPVSARETTGSAPPSAGPRPTVVALAAVAPAASSANSSARPPKVRQASLSPTAPDSSNRTAIYDISAQMVYLPNGRRLEAHSGLGSYMDDPRYVHIRRKGATPPNTYKLVMRESLFHGVQAIRLVPVSGSTMFGRDGILAHHYLLGPSGQSNGCVSLADYPVFLNAFLAGEIDRLVVVERLDNPPPGSMVAGAWFEKALKGLMKPFERGSGT